MIVKLKILKWIMIIAFINLKIIKPDCRRQGGVSVTTVPSPSGLFKYIQEKMPDNVIN